MLSAREALRMALCCTAASAFAQHATPKPAAPVLPPPLRKSSNGAIGVKIANLSGNSYQHIAIGNVSAGHSGDPEVQIRDAAGGFTVIRRFQIDVPKLAPGQASFVSVTAYLAAPQSSYRFSVDGTLVTERPRVIQSHVPTGLAASHRLEIFVPDTITEKNSKLENTVVFQILPE